MIRTDSQCGRILRVLADGKPHTVPEIHRRAGGSRLNSRVAELRKRGCTIECERLPNRRGASAYRYRLTAMSGPLVSALPLDLLRVWTDDPEPENGSYALDRDAYAPRDDPAQRFRVYRLNALDPEPHLLATCETPAAVGVTVCQLAGEGEFERAALGVLDTQAEPGKKWTVNPYDGRV